MIVSYLLTIPLYWMCMCCFFHGIPYFRIKTIASNSNPTEMKTLEFPNLLTKHPYSTTMVDDDVKSFGRRHNSKKIFVLVSSGRKSIWWSLVVSWELIKFSFLSTPPLAIDVFNALGSKHCKYLFAYISIFLACRCFCFLWALFLFQWMVQFPFCHSF